MQKNIFLIGPTGSGKSTIGKVLANELNLQFYDTDKEIETLAGVPIPWIFDIEGEAGFRIRETIVLKKLVEKNNIVIATGAGLILSSINRNLLNIHGINIYLKTSIEQQQQRTTRSHHRPLLATANRAEVLYTMAQTRNQLYEEVADYCFDTTTNSILKITNDIIKFVYTLHKLR